MLDRSLSGARCRTVRPIAHHGGHVPRLLGGSIRYATDNVGRRLLYVDFDSGQSLMVFADDIALDGEDAFLGDS
jgi:hypothetical protein